MSVNNFKNVLVLIVLCHLQKTTSSSKDIQTVCSANEADEGTTGRIEFYINPPIDPKAVTYLLYIRKGDKADIVRCDGLEPTPSLECNVLHKSFKIGNHNGQNLTLVIPQATRDHQGTYTLGGFINGSSFPAASCNVTVKENVPTALPLTNATGTSEDTSNIAIIVAPAVVGVVIVVGIIVAVFVVRKRKHGRKEAEATERMRQRGRGSKVCCIPGMGRGTHRNLRRTTNQQEETFLPV
ncbi:uncharacterized protein [Littorina saxatilis]|uniref:Uncharacterized protein n=1 Tax=Littorina saxatilis TaxID=31220 RepID=A0AAN9BHX6_9CAEN